MLSQKLPVNSANIFTLKVCALLSDSGTCVFEYNITNGSPLSRTRH